MENTAESYCAEINLKGYFLKWFPVHFCRLRLRTMRKNENCAHRAQVANTKFACRKSAMKKFAPQLRTCGFVDYLSQTPGTDHWTILVRGRQRAVCDNQRRGICPGAWQVLDSTWSTERGRQGPPVVPAGWRYPPHLKQIIGMARAAFL